MLDYRAHASRSSLALSNLRAVIILIVVAMHAFVAYLGSATIYAFDKPPYLWRAFPIVDHHRWFGFDIFCAWQDVYLMALLFFLSALFTGKRLARKGTTRFLQDRTLRLGIPYLFGILVLMPISIYPIYRTTAVDPSVPAYLDHLFALPFWDNGPMWFLWLLLVMTVIATGLFRFAPRWMAALAAQCAKADAHPGWLFLGLATAAVVAYVPLALVFTPMAWADRGPLTLQLSRPLMYLVFYLAGLGVGAGGLEHGLLATDGALPRRWARWLAGASLSFAVWLGLTAIAVLSRSTQLGLQIATDIAFAIAAASGCFAALAISLKFGASRSSVMDTFAKNALGLYLVHFTFVVWLQFALLGLALFAIVKGMIVLGLSLVLSLALVDSLRRIPVFGTYLLGELPRPAGTRKPGRPVMAGPQSVGVRHARTVDHAEQARNRRAVV